MNPKFKIGEKVLVSWLANNRPGVIDAGKVVEITFANDMVCYTIEDEKGGQTSAPEKAISKDNLANRVIAKLFK